MHRHCGIVVKKWGAVRLPRVHIPIIHLENNLRSNLHTATINSRKHRVRLGRACWIEEGIAKTSLPITEIEIVDQRVRVPSIIAIENVIRYGTKLQVESL